MANLMQLLIEALRANVRDRNNGAIQDENQLPDEMSGFILQNVQVATTPFIEYEDEDAQHFNPLAQLLHNREKSGRVKKPENISKIVDHIVRLEKKVKVLERSIPTNKFQQRVWLAPASVSEDYLNNEESDYNSEEIMEERERASLNHSGSQRGSGNLKSRASPRPSPLGKKLSRIETRNIRLEKQGRSCFARLLFSRCWTGKDQAAGWKVKRKCPTGHDTSLSCPCGDVGPCQKVKQNACPIDKITSTKKKNTRTTASPSGSKVSRKQNGSNDHKKNTCSTSKQAKEKAVKPNGKPLIEKLFPCCFKEHVHGHCCCHCKDKQALSDTKHSKEVVKSTTATPSAKLSASEGGNTPGDDSTNASEANYDEEESPELHSDSEYQTYNIGTVPGEKINIYEEISPTPDKISRGDRNSTSRCKESKGYKRKDKKESTRETNTRRPDYLNSLPVKPLKSSTSLQIMLHPDISDDRIVEPEAVSHQILKTLSTIHGPMKVEQKIVVQGNENSVVIVTHGETCQCNLCQMLKGRRHHKELVEGLSPQVFKMSSHNGCNTLINHNDGCSCALCRVIDPAVTNEAENGRRKLENANLVKGSSSNDNGSGEKSTPVNTVQTLHSNVTQAIPTTLEGDLENSRNAAYRKLPLFKKQQSMYGKKKTKKCKCTKCRQRRRVQKLKLRLKKEIGAEEYDKILREILPSNVKDSKKEPNVPTCKLMEPSVDICSNDDSAEQERKKKSVSFSDDPHSKRQPPIGRLDCYDGLNTEKMKCRLCEVVGNNLKPGNEILKKKSDTHTSRPSMNHNSTVFSMSESSQHSPDERINSQLMSESKARENELYQLALEEQNCFPPGHMPTVKKQATTKKRINDKTMEEFKFRAEDAPTAYLRRESSCSGGSRRRGSAENFIRQGKEQSTILLSDGAFPPKFVFWSPESRSNVATAYSSESYYLPDQDEFPIVATECDDSMPSSNMNTNSGGGPSLHRVHIPVWFRMMPDRRAS